MIDQIKDINSLVIIQNQIALLKLKTRNCLQISLAGGLFNITPELISHAQIYFSHYSDGRGTPVSAIFLDKNDNPIKIVCVEYFLTKMLERECEVLNEYYVEYEKLKQLKSPVEWLEDE